MERNNKFVNNLISKMTVDQKVGSLLTLGFTGTFVTPDVYDQILKYHCGGLRITPDVRIFRDYVDRKTGEVLVKIDNIKGYKKKFTQAPIVTPTQYKEILRKLQTLAMNRPAGIPLHYSVDQEGGGRINYNFGGVNTFPKQMGIKATGDPKMSYEISLARARQCRAVGLNWMHAPVLDINVNPENPEINIRAYSDRLDDVVEYAMEACRGFKKGGIISTGKHFPGVGDSALGAHFEVQVVDIDKDTLIKRDLLPYKILIEKKLLPTIMLAHSVFPALDEKDIATVSKPIITGLLREKMGFEGVVTTDSMTMYSIASKYGIAVGCAMSLAAGADLVLMKAENRLVGETFNEIKRFVEEGKISEKELDDKVYRILNLKYEYGLFGKDCIPDTVPEDVIRDKKIISLAKSVARKSILVPRDRKKILPLPKDDRILLIEQMTTTPNNIHWHPGMLYKRCLKYNMKVKYLEIAFKPDEEDKANVKKMVGEFDTIVVTNYFKNGVSNNEMAREIAGNKSKKVVVITDTPYKMSIPDEADTVVVIFGPSPENIEAVAGVIFGEIKAEGKWPIEYKIPS
jgi:beta-N-acetylhexosaminidase